VLTVDFSNAFGTVSRQAILSALTSTPGVPAAVTAYFLRFYSSPAPIHHGVVDGPDLAISTGVVQGCPLSPLFFSLALRTPLQETARVLNQGFLSAYLDDVTICAPFDELKPAYDALCRAAASVGLVVNASKCKILLPAATSADPYSLYSIPVVSDGLKLLGVPLGQASYCVEYVRTRGRSVCESISKLESFPNYQARFLLCRHVYNSQLAHLSRLCPRSHGGESIPDAAGEILKSIYAVLRLAPPGQDLPKLARNIFRLPVRRGGLGFRCTRRLVPLDFLASYSDCLRTLKELIAPPAGGVSAAPGVVLQRNLLVAAAAAGRSLVTSLDHAWAILKQLISGYKHHAKSDHSLSVTTTKKDCQSLPRRASQHFSDLLADIYFFTELSLVGGNVPSKAKLVSRAQPGAGAYLQACPADPGLRMDNMSFVLSLRSHLQLDCLPWLFGKLNLPVPSQCPFCSKTGVTDDHALACAALSHYGCHRDLVNAACDMAADADVTVLREVTVTPGSGLRTDFVFRGVHTSGKDIHFDVSVVHDVSSASVEPLQAAKKRAEFKVAKYKALVESTGAHFLPFVFEAFGAFSEEVCAQIDRLSARTDKTEAPLQASWLAPTFTAYWSQRLSVALHRSTNRRFISFAREVWENGGAALYGLRRSRDNFPAYRVLLSDPPVAQPAPATAQSAAAPPPSQAPTLVPLPSAAAQQTGTAASTR
jgi:hypothetical protein